MKESSCCFSGHRPDKMDLGELEIKIILEKAIVEAIDNGYDTFISGMALGTDIWAAEIVLEKKSNTNLKLVCALPHQGFERNRTETEKERFNKILEKADCIEMINNRYFKGCYQIRNEWMVNNSSLVIAVFNGQKGGTKNTVSYAKRRGVNVNNVLE